MRKNLYLALLTVIAFGAVIYFNSNTTESFDKKSLMTEEKGSKERDRPDLAAAHDFEMTKSPILGYPPTEKKIEAFKITKRLLEKKSTAKAIANVSWNERGPNNVGGRTRALMYDPNDASGNKVWAGAVAGGIWFIDDITSPSAEWQNVDDFMSNIAISTIAYDPGNTTTFYAGTGLIFTNDVKGGGIWKSTDAGLTWNHLTSTSPESGTDFDYTQKIVITASSKIIAGTSSGIQVSTNGGDTWTKTLEETITDVELASNGTLYASDYSGNIYKSVDGADNWTTILSGEGGFRVELAPAPSDPNTLYAVSEGPSRSNVGYFKKTTDGGSTWTDVVMPKYSDQDCSESTSDFTRGQAFFDLILGVYPNDPNKVIVGGIDLHRSTDGGTTWQLLSYWTGACADYVHADQHSMLFKDATTALFGNDGGVFYSDNLDAATPAFEERINGYNTALFYSCAAANVESSNTYLAGAQDNGMQKFTDPGINSTTEVTGGDGAFSFIDQDNPDVMISSYVYNSYHRSLDGGVTFTRFVNESQGRFINPCDYDDEANILYAAHDNDAMAVYSNMAGDPIDKSIKSISVGGVKLSHLRVSPYTSNRVFVGNASGGVYIVDKANTTPTVKEIDADALPDGYVSCIEVGSSDDHLLVILSNYDVNSVWETTNGGQTWTSKEGNLPNMPIRWALFNPENRKQVLLATEFGIWSTDDITAATPEWEPTVEGLANVKCNMLQYREADQQVIVATFGRGLFTTNAFSKNTYVEFQANNTFTYIGKDITFENYTTGNATDYLWDFGDGNTSTESAPTHSYSSPGTYTVSLHANTGTKRNIKTDYITILPNREGDYSLTEGGNFDAYSKDFAALNVQGTPFQRGNSSVDGKKGTASGSFAWITGISDAQYVNNSIAYLYTPHFDLSTAGTYELSFKTQYQFEDEWEGFIVEYTLDGGDTWSKLNNTQEAGWYTTISHPQSVFGAEVPIFSGNTGGAYITKNTDVSSLSGSGRVGFRFAFKTDAATVDVGMAIDDFVLSGPQTNATADFTSTPAGLNICEGSVITYYDNSAGSISSYNWNFGAGADPATAVGRGPHEVTYSTSGLKDISLTVEGELNGTQIETKNAYTSISTNNITEKTVSTGSTDLCMNEVGLVLVSDSEAGYTYQLFNADDNTPAGPVTEGNAGTLELETGVLIQPATFYVEVKDMNSTCSAILANQPEINVLPPTFREMVLEDASVCMENTISITVKNSESGVVYRIFNITDSEVFSDDFTGDGSDLILTSYPVMDTIEVEVMGELASCNVAFESMEITPRAIPTATITESGGTLTASEGEKYQWYLNGKIILGANKQTYEVRELGSYTVKITSNDCPVVSTAYEVTVLGLEDLLKSGELNVYPNPTSGVLNIKQNGKFNRMTIYNLMGQIVLAKDIVFQNEVVMLSFLQPGQYILELTGKSESVKLNIQKHR